MDVPAFCLSLDNQFEARLKSFPDVSVWLSTYSDILETDNPQLSSYVLLEVKCRMCCSSIRLWILGKCSPVVYHLYQTIVPSCNYN